MKTIHKYPLNTTGLTTIGIPSTGRVLTAQFQGSTLMLWVEVDDSLPTINRDFVSYGTGWELVAGPQNYIATVQQIPFVWHVYECVKG